MAFLISLSDTQDNHLPCHDAFGVLALTFAAALVGVGLFQVLQRFFQFNQLISGGVAAAVGRPLAERLRCHIHRFLTADAVTKGLHRIVVFAFLR